jgi:hypothetical protein
MSDPLPPGHSRAIPLGMTRDCVDPWVYVEFTVTGEVRPCCARPAIGHLATSSLAEILTGEKAQQVRRNLLSGNMDRLCSECVLKATTPLVSLQAKIETLLQEVRLPLAFNPANYLRANPDVAAAKADPKAHFLMHGRFEGRPLAPDEPPTH